MNLFFDTNIIIGFSIEIDPWHHLSKRVFDKDNLKYWSSTVQLESRRKLRYLLSQYIGFFNEIKDNISKDFITRKEFFDLVENIKFINGKEVSFKQKDLAQSIWDEGGWYDEVNSLEIFNVLDYIIDQMNKTIFPNYNFCVYSLILHVRKNNYDLLFQELNSLEEAYNGKINKVHFPDDNIIIDAHDLACCKKFDLYFISSDKNLLRFTEKILGLTEIKDMYFVEDAYFKI